MPLAIYLVFAHLSKQTFRVVRFCEERRRIIGQQLHLEQQRRDPQRAATVGADDRLSSNLISQLRHTTATAIPPPIDNLSKHLAWDVYGPTAEYVKRSPGWPLYGDVVTSHAQPMAVPRLHELLSSESCLPHPPSPTAAQPVVEVPVKIATVSDTGTVILFGLHPMKVPSRR